VEGEIGLCNVSVRLQLSIVRSALFQHSVLGEIARSRYATGGRQYIIACATQDQSIRRSEVASIVRKPKEQCNQIDIEKLAQRYCDTATEQSYLALVRGLSSVTRCLI
jgi:hypothetical protein